MKIKKLLIICIAAITLVGTSCSSSKNNLNVSNLVNKAYSYISKINNLLSKIPRDCNILNIDAIKDNTVVTLNDVTDLLNQSTTIYNKYKDASTRSSISLTDILNLLFLFLAMGASTVPSASITPLQIAKYFLLTLCRAS